MAKLYYNIKSFSRGINNDADPRDIQRDEFAYLKNFSIDSQGQLKSSGSLFGHNFSSLGGAILPSSYLLTRKLQLLPGLKTHLLHLQILRAINADS